MKTGEKCCNGAVREISSQHESDNVLREQETRRCPEPSSNNAMTVQQMTGPSAFTQRATHPHTADRSGAWEQGSFLTKAPNSRWASPGAAVRTDSAARTLLGADSPRRKAAAGEDNLPRHSPAADTRHQIAGGNLEEVGNLLPAAVSSLVVDSLRLVPVCSLEVGSPPPARVVQDTLQAVNWNQF